MRVSIRILSYLLLNLLFGMSAAAQAPIKIVDVNVAAGSSAFKINDELIIQFARKQLSPTIHIRLFTGSIQHLKERGRIAMEGACAIYYSSLFWPVESPDRQAVSSLRFPITFKSNWLRAVNSAGFDDQVYTIIFEDSSDSPDERFKLDPRWIDEYFSHAHEFVLRAPEYLKNHSAPEVARVETIKAEVKQATLTNGTWNPPVRHAGGCVEIRTSEATSTQLVQVACLESPDKSGIGSVDVFRDSR